MSASPDAADAPLLLLFGPPELRGPEPLVFTTEQRFRLLALLAVHSGQWIGRERVAALFWPEHSAAAARRNLRKVLFDARAVPGLRGLEANERALRWCVGTDLDPLRRASPAQASPAPTALPALRRGALLEGLDDRPSTAWDGWLAAERQRWDETWRDAVLHHLARCADAQQRIDAARALLRADDCDESATAALLDAQQALGQHGEARRSYDAYALRVAERFGVEPARALRDRLRAPGLTARATDAAPHADGFIGRRAELAQARRLLAQPDCRLLTLLGPGGIGKSALALRLLAAPGERFAGGALRIDLQDLASPPALAARIAQALNLAIDDSGDALEQLLRQLPPAPALLALDNAERLPDLGGWLDRLLRLAPQLVLLVASRQRLLLASEWVLPLAGLPVPDDESRDFDAACRFDAVQLFDLRARVAQPGFDLRHHLGAVIDIVDAVGGMPLAIELAASWVRLLPPTQIAAELRQSIDLLERDPGARAPLARPEHASLRAVLDGSWELLSPRERDALAALAVFRGGFTRAAAQAVAGAALPLLSALTDKSLVEVDAQGRFGLHPVVAQHASEHLSAAPQALAEAQRRHTEHQARAVAALVPHLHTDPRPLVLALGAELANTTAAWQHAVAQGRADLVLALLAPLATFFEHRGRAVEGIELLRPALALRATDDASRRVLARTRHALAMLLLRKGDARGGLELAEAAAQQAAQAEDAETAIGARLTASLCQLWLGHAEPARVLAAAALADAQALGERHLEAWALGNLGLAQGALGEHEAAHACAQQSLRLARELQDRHRIVAQWANLGQHHMDQGAWDEARRCFEHGLADCAEIGFVWTQRYLRCSLGQALLALGHKARARTLLERALDDARGAREQPVDWAAELALARLELSEGDADKAAARIARVARAAQAVGADYDVALALAAWAELAATRGEAALAARLIELALAQGKLEAAPRRELQDRLRSLASAAGSVGAPLTLHDALALIEADGAATKR